MPIVHRQDDTRVCGATTIVTGQSTVKAGGKLISVVGDKESHGEGAFTSNGRTVRIGGISVITLGDPAEGDNATHPPSLTKAGSGLLTVIIG